MFAIETRNLTKKYRPPGRVASIFIRTPIKSEVVAVDRVSLEIRQGELFGLIGPNGAGKTTLTKMLCTLLLPTQGTALINGHDVVKDENQAKASIGFVSSEERSFYWRLTGRQNLMFFAALSNLDNRIVQQRVSEVLKRVGLEDAADNMVYSYSTGMKQKLSIARGLLIDPQILFLDEPTRSIDPLAARELKRFIKDELVERDGKTVFLTSHRLEEVEEMCDRFAIINKGRITFCGTLHELRQTLQINDSYILRLKNFPRAEVDRLVARNSVEYISIDVDDETGSADLGFVIPEGKNLLSSIIADVSDRGAVVTSCERQAVRLEDMFIEHMSKGVRQ